MIRKPYLMLFLLTIGMYTQAQVYSPLTFSEVVNVDSVKSEELYKRAKEWLFKTYVSSPDVIALDDKESRTIAGNGAMSFNPKGFGSLYFIGNIKYKITIVCKDGRYKVEIGTFFHKSSDYRFINESFGLITTNPKRFEGPTENIYNKYFELARDKCKADAANTLKSLQKAMVLPSTSAQEW